VFNTQTQNESDFLTETQHLRG